MGIPGPRERQTRTAFLAVFGSMWPWILASSGTVLAQESSGTIYVGEGESPIRIVRPPGPRWAFRPRPEPEDPSLEVSILDLELGARIDLFTFRDRSGAGGDVALEVARGYLREAELTAELVKGVRKIGPRGDEYVRWTFEGRAMGSEELGVVLNQFVEIPRARGVSVVATRVPGPARTGPAASATQDALEYVAASIVVDREGGGR